MKFTEFLAAVFYSVVIIFGYVVLLENLAVVGYIYGPRIYAKALRQYRRRRYPPPWPEEVWRIIKDEEITVGPTVSDVLPGGKRTSLSTDSLLIEYLLFDYEGKKEESVEISLVICPKAGSLTARFANGELLGVTCSNWEIWQIAWPEALSDSRKYCFHDIARYVREAVVC
jgi:hypothetical protein